MDFGDGVPGLVEVVTMLASGVGVGAVLAFLFEHFSFFQQLSAEAKWWLVFGASLGLPLVAVAALQFVPVEAWAMLQPYWQAVAAGFVTWAGSQVVHRVFNNGK